MSGHSRLCCAALLVSASLAHAQAPCDCSDVPDLINRLNMAHAAIDKYQDELAKMSKTAMVDGLETGGGNNRDALQGRVNKDMGEVKRLGLKDFEGKTPGITCKQIPQNAPACVTAVMDAHETVHEKACDADKLRRKLGKNDDRLVGMPLTAYANEEIRGYEAEIDDIMKRLRAMPASCRPVGWVGFIYSIELKHDEGTVVSPPHAKYALEHKRTHNQDHNRWGTIWLDGPQSSAYWHIEHLATRNETSGLLTNCEGSSLKPKVPSLAQTSTVVAKTSGRGFSNVAPPVNVGITFDGLYYELSFDIPEVKGDFSGTSTTTNSGCKNDTSTVELKNVEWRMDPSATIRFRGQVKRQTRYVGGSDTFDFTPPGVVSIPGVDKNYHKVKVTWHLYKIE